MKKEKFPKAELFLKEHPEMDISDAIQYLDAAIKGKENV